MLKGKNAMMIANARNVPTGKFTKEDNQLVDFF